MRTLLFEESPRLAWGAACVVWFFAPRGSPPWIAWPVNERGRMVRGIAVLLVWLALAFFYRLPSRFVIPSTPEEALASERDLLSPSDGRVVAVRRDPHETHVVVFLHLGDCHVQWCPMHHATVKRVTRVAGTFHPAYLLRKSQYNERVETVWDVGDGRGEVRMVQIAGQLARRIVNHLRVGQIVGRNDRVGMIKLSSRVDLYFPTYAYEPTVRVGDRVVGNRTRIARGLL